MSWSFPFSELGKSPTRETPWAGVLSARWIKEDVEGMDAVALEMRDIRAGDGYGTIWRSGLPAQPSDTVMTDCGTNRFKDEVWRQVRQECFYRTIDGSVSLRLGIRFVQRCVFGVELGDGFGPTGGVALAEHP